MLTLKTGDKGEHVALVQRILKAGGYYSWKIDGDFGSRTRKGVRDFQEAEAHDQTGIVDPLTFESLLEFSMKLMRRASREQIMLAKDLTPHEDAPLPHIEDTLEPSDEVDLEPALAWAEAEWKKIVQEPRGTNWELIDDYIRGTKGLEWTWEDRYDKNGEFAWCGAFACRALGEIGLRREIRIKKMASTYRIVHWAKGTDRYLEDPRDCKPGDIVIVGDKRKSAGNHITLCRGVDGDEVLTFEGNARGPGSDGTKYEGVIRRRRPFERQGLKKRTYRVMHAIRIKAGDLDA